MILRDDVSLAPLTTLRIGGRAARMVDLDRESDVIDAVRFVEGSGGSREERAQAESRASLFVLGEGSNVVVGDDGVTGLVACMKTRGVDVRREGGRVVVDVAAGERWDGFVERAAHEGWRGIECMSGIPGLVGATPIQNVGAYGQEVSDTVVRVRVFDRAAAAFVEMDRTECGFGYRTSVFKRTDRFVVTSVRFDLEEATDAAPPQYAELSRALDAAPGTAIGLRTLRDTVIALRRGKGMIVDPQDPESVSAGSFFVNPIVDAATVDTVEARAGARPPVFAAGPDRYKLAAAWLVERAGFPRGWTQGRVGISRKHALALVNRGGATARELLMTARAIRDGVRASFGVELEPEPVFVGCSW